MSATVEELEAKLAGMTARISAADEKRRAAEAELATATATLGEQAKALAAAEKAVKAAEKTGAALEALTARAAEHEAAAAKAAADLAAAADRHQRDLLMADTHGLGPEARDYMAYRFGKAEKPGAFDAWLDAQREDPIYKAFTSATGSAADAGKGAADAAAAKVAEAHAAKAAAAARVDPSRGVLPPKPPAGGAEIGVQEMIRDQGRGATFERLFGVKPAVNIDRT